MITGWQTKRLSDACLIQPPKSEAKQKLNSTDMVSFVPMDSLGIGKKYFDTSLVRPLEQVVGSYTYFAEGDVLLAKITPCFENGKLGIAQNLKNGIGFGSSEYIVFRGSEELNNQFLYYYLSRETFREDGAKRMTGAVGHKRVAKDFIENSVIPIPPFHEQQRIVSILDEAFADIAIATANAEKNLANARELFESYLQSVFTNKGDDWRETTISEISQVKGGKRVPKGYKLSVQPTLFPYLRVTDFNDYGSIDVSDLRYLEIDVHSQIKNYIITSKDLYISIAGTIGKTGIIPNELNGANLTENACRLVFKENISNWFVYYFTRTASFIEQAGLNTRTAAQPKLALSRLSSIQLALPSYKEQLSLVSKFDELSTETKKLEAIYQQKLIALNELKKSILNQAFSGKL